MIFIYLMHVGDLTRWRSQLPLWVRAIKSRTGPYSHADYGKVCCFIDGTCIRTTRPTSGRTGFHDFQRLFWSGYKKCHVINFSIIVAPNGLCIDCCGPVPGRHSDKWVQSWSNTEMRLNLLFQDLGFTCYGDGIYTSSRNIRRKLRGLLLTPQQQLEIHNLNGVRTSVEHNFGGVHNNFPFVSFKYNKQILKSKCGVGNLYKVATLLHNFKICCRGSQGGGGVFGVLAPSLSDYINGGVQTNDVPNISTI